MKFSPNIPWESYRESGLEVIHRHPVGRVSQVVGWLVEGAGPRVSIGDVCDLFPERGKPVKAEVVGFRSDATLLMPLGSLEGIRPGSIIRSLGHSETFPVGDGLLGRVVDAMGSAMDGRPLPKMRNRAILQADPINPMSRRRIEEPLDVGVRAINAALTIGRGQRLGIFAGSGVGKSTLLSVMARNTDADITVIGLIGERGREVSEFIEKDLGEEGLARSVVVVATSDQPPVLRLRAAYVATAIAEYFRGTGRHVLLMMDSLTRFAMAQREVGLSAGEPPTSKGYPPSTFMLLPKLLERTGRDDGPGSITGLYTVLMEGDDLMDPIVDAVRGILDGHLMLSRDLAARNHYPAIDLLGSISRLMKDLVSPEQNHLAGELRDVLSAYDRAEDMINIGAYVSGSNPGIDRAIKLIEPVRGFLQQGLEESATLEESFQTLEMLFSS